jgi:hypothetical protein
MNHRLSEIQIRGTCRELVARGKAVSGRRLRRELETRFGHVGNTARVFQIWREETRVRSPMDASPALPADVVELQRRLELAETSASDNLARAERAEYREQAHQDHWAMEVDRLRQEVQVRQNQAVEIRHLNEQVLRLSAELHAVRTALAHEAQR